MSPENEPFEALDRLVDRLQHGDPAADTSYADVDLQTANVVRELWLLASDTPIPQDLVQKLERRLTKQIESRVTPRPQEPGAESRSPDDGPRGARSDPSIAPRALAAQETERRELFDALRTPIVTTSMSGRVTGFNAAAISLFGAPQHLYDRNIRDVLPFVPLPRHASEGGDAQGRVADAFGRTVDLEVSRTVLSEHDASHGYAVYVVHDISRHAELNRLREQLLYSVAHELRNPLMVLDNALELLESDYLLLTAQEFDQVLGTARRSALRMRTLMDDLLSAGSIQSGHFVVVPRRIELDSIVIDAMEIVSPAIEGRGQRVELDLAEERLPVLADRRYARTGAHQPAGECLEIQSRRFGTPCSRGALRQDGAHQCYRPWAGDSARSAGRPV